MSGVSHISPKYSVPYFILVLSGIVLITGFYFDLDFTQRSGCLIFPEKHLIPYRIFYTSFSLVMFSVVAIVKTKRLALSLLATEITFSLLIFLFFKGGYAVGYTGGASEMIFLYDFTQFGLRFWLISQVIHQKRHSWFQLGLVLILTVSLLILKMQKLSFPVFEL